MPMGQRQGSGGLTPRRSSSRRCWRLLPSPLTLAQGTAVFSRVDVAGNQRIEADTIRVFAGIEPGQPVTPEQLNLAVRNLFDTGLFEDVQVMPEAGRLVITVVENPTINQIAFEGNDSLDDEELNAVVQLRPRLAYSVAAAEPDAQRIIDAYRAAGRYAAEVTPVIIRQPDNRVDLVFEITEGGDLGAARQLRRQPGLLRPAAAPGDPDQPGELAELPLRRRHLRPGPARGRPGAAAAVLPRARLHRLPGALGDRQLTRERTGFFLSFTVSEGQRFNFGQVSVSSSIPGPQRRGLRAAAGAGGRRAASTTSRWSTRVVERMAFQAGQAGYAFVEIGPQVTRNEAGAHRRHQLPAGRGRAGLRRADRHLRQHPHARPGDPPAVPHRRGRRLQRARDPRRRGPHPRPRLLQRRPSTCGEGSAPGQALVDVQVEEQPTGSLSLGGAFSTERGLSAQISLTERNFLGRGQTVTATVSASSQFANYELGFYEPALFDRDLLAGFTIFYRDRNFEEQSFKTSTYGIEPRVGFPLSENGRR